MEVVTKPRHREIIEKLFDNLQHDGLGLGNIIESEANNPLFIQEDIQEIIQGIEARIIELEVEHSTLARPEHATREELDEPTYTML